MEALRYMPYLSPQGWIVTNSVPFVNIPNYPELDNVIAELSKVRNLVMLDVDTIAKECGNTRAANMVLLGAASPFLGMDAKNIEDGIERIFGRKGAEVVELNIKALRAGRAVAENK